MCSVAISRIGLLSWKCLNQFPQQMNRYMILTHSNIMMTLFENNRSNTYNDIMIL